MSRRHLFPLLTALALASGIFWTVAPALAQVDTTGLQTVGAITQLPNADPRVIAARLINTALGVLGVIMLALVLYAGFLWMTAGGKPEQVDKAKAYLRNAIIGVVIILSSWAIATFVINRLLQATGGGGGGVSGGGGGGLGGGFGGGGTSSFQVRAISPSGDVPLRNVQVRFLFTRDVDAATASTTIQVIKTSDNSPVPGVVTVNGSLVTFAPTAACPAPNTDRRCFDGDTQFTARVGGSLRSTSGQVIACGGFAPACEAKFKTGNLVDTAPPGAVIISPIDGQSVPDADLVHIVTRTSDDTGVSLVETMADGAVMGRDSSQSSSTPLVFDADIVWDTAGVSVGQHKIQSTVHDIDTNDAVSQSITLVVRPKHCFNGAKDADETGLDCGGSCGACAGGACTQPSQCASGVCVNGVCTEQPVITGISPGDGGAGTFVTISGVNFGANPGRVVFFDNKQAAAPAACAAGGAKTWTPTQVVVAVPADAGKGPIRLENTGSKLFDLSNDDRGPVLPDFKITTTTRPGLCGAVPSHAQVGASLSVIGGGLGSTPGKLFFNDKEITSLASWSDASIGLQAPVVSPATYAVKANASGLDSNAVDFTVDQREVTGDPVIQSVEPAGGPVGEYVTLTGRNFGDSVGVVRFKNLTSGEEGSADVKFPAACSSGFWRDAQIIVKVPSKIGSLGVTDVKAGNYQIYVVRSDRAVSAPMSFAVVDGAPKPGLCAMEPGAGPIDTEVKLIGERFGSSLGSVTFRGANNSRLSATVETGKWQDGQIITRVPRGAVTGPVTVAVDKLASNGLNFAVKNCQEDASICVSGETCCPSGACSVGGACPSISLSAQYAWRTSTGLIPLNPEVVEECNEQKPPSPSPWLNRKGGDNACLNADLVVRFNTKLDPKTVTGQNFLVSKCSGSGADPCVGGTVVPGLGKYPQVMAADTDTDFVLFRPNLAGGVWEASTTYQVVLTTGIQSDTKLSMLEKAAQCGRGNAYCFRFTTRPAGAACAVGLITVTPHPFTADKLGQTMGYHAAPRAAGDVCIQLNGSSMNWSWNTGGDGRADITNNLNPDLPHNVMDDQTGTALAETGDKPVLVNADVAGAAGKTVRGTAQLFVRFVPPQVEAYGPNCDQACANAALWARFNVPLLPSSVTPQNIILRRCFNENCQTYDPVQPFDLANSPVRLSATPGAPADAPLNYVVIEPTHLVNGVPVSYLEPGRFYKVTVRGGAGGIMSYTRLPLTNLNDPDGFSWTFRVKQGAEARCATVKVDVLPAEKYEKQVGDRQLFAAAPASAPDACNKDGQPLISDRTYAWTAADTNVAKFINGSGDGIIDTTPNLPPHCSQKCLNLGADGTAGYVANCGNGKVETTNKYYCVNGKTPFGDACVLLPVGSKGAEECDLGGASNGPNSFCGANCLWNPVRSVLQGGTCGNRLVDRGEQCDFGRSCVGGANIGRDCVVDADCGDGKCDVAARFGCSATCQALGSVAGKSTCGNNDWRGYGKTCDDGNVASGDGCSSDCLDEGSSAVVALCGNGILEPGESCEKNPDGSWPIGCNAATCLHTGGITCGNGKVENGEDCDDGNNVSGDGCSSRCLLEGASAAYAKPSFCGDGVKGTGEQCEAAKKGDGLVDPVQLAQVVGNKTPDADGRMSTQLKTVYDNQNGAAVYGLQCGYKKESDCSAGYGLTNEGCCAPRPALGAIYPINNAGIDAGKSAVCRNVLISGTFDQALDPNTVQNNFMVAVEGAAGKCPAGLQPLDQVPFVTAHWWQRLALAWQRIRLWFTGQPAEAALWCAGSVKGKVTMRAEGQGSKVSFMLDSALAPNTVYHVFFRGDPNLADDIKQGIKTARGVTAEADPAAAMSGHLSWSFKTGTKICAADHLEIRDTDPNSPLLFTSAGEKHAFEASVNALQDGLVVPLSIIKEYSWSWQSWVSSQTDVFQAVGKSSSDALSTADVTAENKNGSSLIFASIRIDNDQVNVPSSTGSVITASVQATALLCENPWPSRTLAPFTDTENSKSLAALAPLFKSGPFYNFSSAYCLDWAATGTADDLPSFVVHAVPVNAADAGRGILRQYLLTPPAVADYSALRGDGIGIRVVANPLHLSPAAWYASLGFGGAPQATAVDGYEAVKSGTTVYVASVNADKSTGGPVTSTIYLISRNPDAKPETQAIYDQLVKNWTFNVNFQGNSQNICLDGAGNYVIPAGTNSTVACTADWECANYGTGLSCAGFKAKLQRDTKRLADFQTFTGLLEKANKKDGSYPKITAGTYLQTITNSRWPSWQGALGAALGGPTMPQDPVNRFLTCGHCRDAKVACMADADCPSGKPGVSDVCLADNNYDPATCWNAAKLLYHCPADGSHIYQYRAVDGGARYQLSTDLEGPRFNRYQPALLTVVRQCSNNNRLLCSGHAAGATFDPECNMYSADGSTILSQGTCNQTGGSWQYEGVCTGKDYGLDGGICGNGVRGPGEVCEVGETATQSCTTKDGKPGTKVQVCSDCKGFVDGPSTQCVADATCGNGRVDKYKCYGGAGFKYGQPCNAPMPAVASQECADPRDPAGTSMQCLSVSTKGGSEEQCDDGVLNGTYGHCRIDCKGTAGYCGDNMLSAGETCDNGLTDPVYANGNYCGASCTVSKSCAIDCRSIAPYCGDKKVDGGFENCDGNTLTTTGKICATGSGNNAEQPCTGDADCGGTAGSCGGNASHQSCVGVTIGRCAGTGKVCNNDPDKKACDADKNCPNGSAGSCLALNQVQCASDVACGQGNKCIQSPTQHVRTCKAPGEAGQCGWNVWTECKPTSYCGDNKVDPGEECDDGNNNNKDACTNTCRKNICGDGIPNVGVEECDLGTENGQIPQNPEYGATVIGCTKTCHFMAASGGYCGDGKQYGPEQCDGKDIPKTNCKALGYDFALQTGAASQPGSPASPCAHLAYLSDANGDLLPDSVWAVNGYPDYPVIKTAAVTDAQWTETTQAITDMNAAQSYGYVIHPASSAPEAVKPSALGACVASAPSGGSGDVITCDSACHFAGCGKCQDVKGTGTLTGYVMDAVYSFMPVPNARVALYLRGIKIAETFTDGDGKYTFSQLNERPECASYRVVADSYQDNPCTGKPPTKNPPNCNKKTWPDKFPQIDEGKNGGYWPFESNTFNLRDFVTQGLNKIYMAPRVGPDETLVIYTWQGAMSRDLGMHLLLPPKIGFGYCDTGDQQCLAAPGICSYPIDSTGKCPALPYGKRFQCPYGSLQSCKRDVTAEDDSLRVIYENKWLPYANMHCFDANGAEVPGCGAGTTVMTSRYRRGDWALIGKYSFYVVDHSGTQPFWPNYDPKYNQSYDPGYYSSVGSLVRVVTHDRLYAVAPPSTVDSSSCTSDKKEQGRYWLAFQQDAGSGLVTLNNRLLCAGVQTPDEPSGVLLPKPLLYTGSCWVISWKTGACVQGGGWSLFDPCPVSSKGGCNPAGLADPDNDGLTTDQELLLGTYPNIWDTDGDGLSDGDEVSKYGTDPLKADTDGDGVSDGDEVKNGTDPLKSGFSKCPNPGCLVHI